MQPNRLAQLWPVALLVVTAGLMVRSHLADPYDPTLTGTARYGHNHEGALVELLLWCLGELVVLNLVLAPGRRHQVWRAAVALALFVPWAFLSLMLTMHAGGIIALHALWTLALCLGIVVTLVARIVGRPRR